MPTLPYYNAKGERLPGVTWVIGQNVGWNKDALKFWANREGLAGRAITRDYGGATLKTATDIGTAVHAMIEARINEQEPKLACAAILNELPEAARDKAKRGFGSFERWYRQTKITIVATEAYLIDEEYQTGGCLDGIGLEENEHEALELSCVDWKTSKGTYADHVLQVAAYTTFAEKKINAWLLEAVGVPGVPTSVVFAGAHILRVDKASGAFSHKFIPRDSLERAWQCFTWARALHHAKPEIEAMIR